MNFRAIVQDGLIIVNTHGSLPDGTPVEISVAKRSRIRKTRGQTKKRSSCSRHAPGFGMWADRTELGPASEAVDLLRSLTRKPLLTAAASSPYT